MFPIPGVATLHSMTDFYTDWLSGQTKSDALRESALHQLQERRHAKGTAHSRFWGGFILVGAPN